MNRLQAELLRLYLPHLPQDQGADAEASSLIGADGRVRAMVLALARPADWDALSALWRGVQADLQLPAPAIAISGMDGYQLWFSLREPVSVADAQDFLQSLRQRYLADIAAQRITLWPAADASAPQTIVPAAMVPARLAETGHWSAFVAPDLAALFADEPWLDLPPGAEAQAELLSRLESIQPDDWRQALEQLGGRPSASSSESGVAGAPAGPGHGEHKQGGPHSDPRQFLLEVMNDRSVELRLRIEAAKALLAYGEELRRP